MGQGESSWAEKTLTWFHRHSEYLFFKRWGRRKWRSIRNLHGPGNPMLALLDVEFVSSVIMTIHSIAVRTHEIIVRVFITCCDPLLPLVTRGFL